jgi:glutathione S-transferase
MKGGGRTPEFLAVNPNGKIPALTDGAFSLWESRAICIYLASKKPEAGLMPDAPQARAVVEQWLFWQAIHLGPAMQKLTFERVFKAKFGRGAPDPEVVRAQEKDLAQFLPILDAALDGRE